MPKLKGITITLYEQTQTGVDDFRQPIYEETAVAVDNVLVGEPTTDEARNTLDMIGKHVAYTLGIPKGDTHDWKDKRVSFFGQDFMTIGVPIQGIDELVPLSWGKKVYVERYE